jgi:hypothetical protein
MGYKDWRCSESRRAQLRARQSVQFSDVAAAIARIEPDDRALIAKYLEHIIRDLHDDELAFVDDCLCILKSRFEVQSHARATSR